MCKRVPYDTMFHILNVFAMDINNNQTKKKYLNPLRPNKKKTIHNLEYKINQKQKSYDFDDFLCKTTCKRCLATIKCYDNIFLYNKNIK